MKTIVIIIIGIIFLGLFTFSYYLFLDKINYGVLTLEEYKENPECDFTKLNNGWTQINNCEIYKYNP